MIRHKILLWRCLPIEADIVLERKGIGVSFSLKYCLPHLPDFRVPSLGDLAMRDGDTNRDKYDMVPLSY